MVLFYRRRHHHRNNGSSEGQLKYRLLPVLDDGAPTAANMAERIARLAQRAEYHETGFPSNAAAKEVAVLNWNSGGSSAVINLPFAELAKATSNFDASNSLGEGGSCDVFTGSVFAETASGGVLVAVKRLNAGASDWGKQQFTAEMKLLTRISHPNVVRLYAFSTDGPHRCLVLELCPGGALNDRLRATAEPLQWQQRVRIVLHILLALEHLHSLTPQMIHRDLKTPNVLLDADGNAKVADFGTVREGVVQGAGTKVTHIVTENRPGTRGYMAPEYYDFGQVSTRTDVYSFGIILLELLMGMPARKVVDMLFDDRDFFDHMREYADARAGAWPKKAVKALAGVAKGCTEYRPRERAAVRAVLPKVKALQKSAAEV
jgi:serine/threonine protein kinase